MNIKTTLALVALAALVGAYFWFFSSDAPPRHELERMARQAVHADGDRLLPQDVAADAVTGITIERAGQSATLQRRNGRWMQVEPVSFPLNDHRPQQVVEAAAGLRHVGRFMPGRADQPTAAELALEPTPRAAVTLHLNSDGAAVATTIRLGRSSTGGRAYAMIEGDPHIYVVDDTLHNAVLTGQISDWRRRSFDPPNAAQLRRVTIDRPGEPIALTKLDGRWFLDEHGGERADAEAVQQLVRDAGGFYISEFMSDDPQRLAFFGLEEPRIVVRFERTAAPSIAGLDGQAATPPETPEAPATPVAADAGEVHVLRIGAPTDLQETAYFATWSEGDEPSHVVFAVDRATVEKLTASVDRLRDPRVVLAQAGNIREVRLARGEGASLVLQRTPERWVFGDPAHGSQAPASQAPASQAPGFALDPDAARGVVDAIASARAQGYSRDLPTGRPTATIAVYTTGGPGAERVFLFGPQTSGDGKQYLALREGERVGYLLDQESVEPLLQPAIALRDRGLLAVDPDQLASLRLTQPDGTELAFTREATDDGQAWTLADHDAFERDALSDLLRSLQALRVESWKTTRMAFEPDVVLTLGMREGTERSLRVESASGRGEMDGVEPMFTLPPAFVASLDREYRDRLLLPLAIADIGSVKYEHGGATLLIRREGGDYVDGEGVRVNQAAAAGAFDTLANLRVERYLEVGDDEAFADGDVVTITVERRNADAEADAVTLAVRVDEDLGRLGERWFRLGEERYVKLLGPLTAPSDGGEAMPPAGAMPAGPVMPNFGGPGNFDDFISK